MEDDDFDWRPYFVQYPPEAIPECEIGTARARIVDSFEAFKAGKIGGEPSSAVAVFVECDLRRFKEDGDPVSAIQVLIACEAAKVYPPTSVLKWLADAFYKFDRAAGKADLRKLLGLAAEGRGKADTYASRISSNERYDRAYNVHLLHTHFRYSIEKAAEMVEAREKDFEGVATAASWIEEDYKKNYRKKFLEEGEPEFPDGFWESYLESFPEYSRRG